MGTSGGIMSVKLKQKPKVATLTLRFPILTTRGIVTSPTTFLRLLNEFKWLKFCPYKLLVYHEDAFEFDCDWHFEEGVHEPIEGMPYLVFPNKIYTPVWGTPIAPFYIPIRNFCLSWEPVYRPSKIEILRKATVGIIIRSEPI